MAPDKAQSAAVRLTIAEPPTNSTATLYRTLLWLGIGMAATVPSAAILLFGDTESEPSTR
jgi:hypothetical protein